MSTVRPLCPQGNSCPSSISVLFCKKAKLCRMHVLGPPLTDFHLNLANWNHWWEIGGQKERKHFSLSLSLLGSKCSFWSLQISLDRQSWLLHLLGGPKPRASGTFLSLFDTLAQSWWWFPVVVSLWACLAPQLSITHKTNSVS